MYGLRGQLPALAGQQRHGRGVRVVRDAGAAEEGVSNKYGARKVDRDGYRFDSQRECDRYEELRMEMMAGTITLLDVHPRFVLSANEQVVGHYTADFSYFRNGDFVVEDVKSRPTRTEAYRLRKKLVKALYGVEIREVE